MAWIGPDQTKRRQAWGAPLQPTAPKTSFRARALSPKIVVTHQSAARYPSPKSLRCREKDRGEENENKRVTAHRKKRSGKGTGGKWAQKTKTVQLAYSTIKPKPKRAPSVPRGAAWEEKIIYGSTHFEKFYDRGDLPVCIGHGAKRRVHWKCRIEDLDYGHYLPLFFEGLRVSREPYTFLAYQGVLDLLKHGKDKILPVVPQLVIPIKTGLSTRRHSTIVKILKALQALTRSSDYVGEALVPYYRQILPVFNLILLLDNRKSRRGRSDYGHKRKVNLRELVFETLEALQATGGADAYVNIKYMVPTHN